MNYLYNPNLTKSKWEYIDLKFLKNFGLIPEKLV